MTNARARDHYLRRMTPAAIASATAAGVHCNGRRCREAPEVFGAFRYTAKDGKTIIAERFYCAPHAKLTAARWHVEIEIEAAAVGSGPQ